MTKNVLVIVSSLLMIFSVAPYLIDEARKKTKPKEVTWVTWTFLTGIAAAATFASHEPKTAILTLVATISTGLVVLLGLKFGFARVSLFDLFCWAGVVTGFILWILFNRPVIAILAAVAIDLIATLPTLRHSWLKPKEETWQTYFLSAVAGGLLLISLTSYNVAGLAYPVYIFLSDGAITATIIISRRRKRLTLSR